MFYVETTNHVEEFSTYAAALKYAAELAQNAKAGDLAGRLEELVVELTIDE